MNNQIDELLALLEAPTSVDRERASSLYMLASKVENGAIFELGKYYALGVLALCLGAQDTVPVFSVDCLARPNGWSGKLYSHPMAGSYYGLIDIARMNIEKLNRNDLLFVLTGEMSDVAHSIIIDISLLVWDVEIGNTMTEFVAWDAVLPVGGLLALYSTEENPRSLYTQIKSRYKIIETLSGGITVLEKEKNYAESSDVSPTFKVRIVRGEWN